MYVAIARRVRQEGRDLDGVLEELRAAGASMADSVKAIREVDGVSVGEAKRLIDASHVYADWRASNEVLRDELETALLADDDHETHH
jgi:ribosomal protein L7/L12